MGDTQATSRPLIAISVAASSRSSASCASSTWSVGATERASQKLHLDHNFNNIQEFSEAASGRQQQQQQQQQAGDINRSTQCDANLLTTLSNCKTNQNKTAAKKNQSGSNRSSCTTGNQVNYNDNDELDDQEEQKTPASVDRYDKGVQQLASDGLSNVDQVRNNFIVLIRYNKLQYFYIGAIIYSVINLLFLLIGSVMMMMKKHEAELVDDVMSSNCQHLIWTTGRRDNEIQSNISWLMFILIIIINLALASIVALTLIEFNSMEYKSKTTPTATTNGSITRISNQSTKWLLQSLGISLATILLVMPIEIIYVNNVAQNYSNVTQLIDVCSQGSAPNDISYSDEVANDENGLGSSQVISWIIANCRLPVAAIGALLYSLPLLLEEAPTLAKLICCCLMLPPVLVVPLEYLSIKQQQQQQPPPTPTTPSISEQEPLDLSSRRTEPINASGIFVSNEETTFLSFSIFYLLVAFIAGLLKRSQLGNFVRRLTFDGANELIEAKVSLEQQRQQQETLLLSVLPAYVAEQVKRNMVKKMASLDDQTSVVVNNNTSFAPTEVQLINPSSATSATVTTLAGQQQQVNFQPTGRGSFIMTPSEAKSSNATGDGGAGGGGGGGGAGSSTRSSFIKSSSKFLGELSMGLKSAKCNPSNNHTSNQGGANNNNHSPQQQSNHLLLAPNQSQLSIQSNMNLSAGGPGGGGGAGGSSSSQARRGFNELYIRTYNNVSLLYGDIVGFTRLCTQLSSSQLVSVLNDLFSHFDHLAERHKIMRIKILGDCYYGVSGIPEFAVMGAKSRAKSNENHAINCVNMGLDMIQYIKCLNIERSSSTSNNMAGDGRHQHQVTSAPSSGGGGLSHSVSANDQSMSGAGGQPSSSFVQIKGAEESRPTGERAGSSCSVGGQLETITAAGPPMPAFELNMRIGVHTGHIHSGVIGLKKWQFDVWSNDVSIAMHCESSGVAGRVQVTEATVQHLHGSFALELAPRSDRDAYLADKEIKTYLIRERVQSSLAPSLGPRNQSMPASSDKRQPAQQSAKRNRSPKGPEQRSASNNINGNANEGREMDEEKIREATIGTIRQTLLAGEAANASSMNAYGLALDHNDMSPIDLQFNESSLEKLYHRRLVSSGSILFELAVLFLLLGLLVSSVDIQLGGSFVRRHERLILVSVLTIALLLAAHLLLPQHHLEKTTSNGHRGSKRGSSLYKGLDLARNLDIIVDYEDENNNSNHQSAHDYKDPAGVQTTRNSLDFIKKSPVVDQLRLAIRSFCWPAFRFICMLRARQRRVNGNKLSPMIGLTVFMIVILVQVYLLLGQYCHQLTGATQTTSSRHFLIEQYQMTVIIIIVALDSSVHLMSYRRKHKLLLGLVLLQVVVLSTSFNEPGARVSMKHEHSTQMLCNCFIDNHLNGSFTTPSAGNETNAAGGGHRQSGSKTWTTTSQQFICWSSDALLLVLALWSLAFNRQLDYSSRANFLWRQRLNVDHEELEYISGINKVLLENILPSHVVQHYLTNPSEQAKSQFSSIGRNFGLRMSFSNMRNLHDELYHEQHDSVAVMFASIPHFYEFYDESDISKQGLGCIALLNEIICDFDKLLLKNKFSRIEKIKTIGSTYMAAAGLRPNTSNSNLPGGASPYSLSHRNSAVSQLSQGSGGGQQLAAITSSLLPGEWHDNYLSPAGPAVGAGGQPAPVASSPDELRRQVIGQQKMNLICMIQFATSLMTALNGINKQSFQVFKLRVGVNTGPVIAGVIGAQRPFYDIWGDCVNIASRMESLGEVGRIQVEERTAKLLLECLCNDTYSIVRRGPIDVKGKGGMVTYFVDKKQVGGGGSCSSPVQPSQVVGGFSANKAPDTPTKPTTTSTTTTANKLIDCHRQVAGTNLRADEQH